jgi:hypothetical protein
MSHEVDFEPISPFTGNTRVIVEHDDMHGESRVCFDTGFQTSDRLKEGSDTQQEFHSNIPMLVRSLSVVHDEHRWYPMTAMAMGVMLYPDGADKSWNWAVSFISDIPEDRQKDFPIPGSPDQYYTQGILDENISYFMKESFEEALDHFYALIFERHSHA